MVKHMADMDLKRMDAVTQVQAISLATEGGDPLERLGHLYPPTEFAELKKRMQEKREEEQELARQQALMITLQRYASVKRLGYDDSRKHK